MAHMTLLDCYYGALFDPNRVETLTNEQLLYSYLIINGNFTYTTNVNYHFIPCYIDNTPLFIHYTTIGVLLHKWP